MQSPASQLVVSRFFQALALLKQDKLTNKTAFALRHGINRRALYLLEQNHSRDIFQVEWLSILVRDYGVSPLWLLLGEGPFYAKTCK